MTPFIHIKSAKFSTLPGEAEQIINEGADGKALVEYLADRLHEFGCGALFSYYEDWGYGVELTGYLFAFVVCIYGCLCADGRRDHDLSEEASPTRRWSWRRFRFECTGVEEAAATLQIDLVADGHPPRHSQCACARHRPGFNVL